MVKADVKLVRYDKGETALMWLSHQDFGNKRYYGTHVLGGSVAGDAISSATDEEKAKWEHTRPKS